MGICTIPNGITKPHAIRYPVNSLTSKKMSNIYKDGVEVHCPAVYVSSSASEAIERVAIQANDECNRLYAAASEAEEIYGNSSTSTPIDYFLLDEDDD